MSVRSWRTLQALAWLAAAFLASEGFTFGQTEGPRGSATAPEPRLTRIDEHGAPALYEMTLPNGLTAVIDGRPGRRTVYCEIGVRVGSRNEPLELAGMSHLLEHLLFKEGEAPGSRKNPAFSRIRAAGGEVNASTEFERTNYYCDVGAAAFEEGWRGLAGLVTAVGFDSRDLEVERKVVLEEAALNNNDPLSIAAYSILDKLFPKDALSQPVIGFRKSLTRIKFEDIDAYYKRFYVPANAYALIVGDVDPQRAAALVAETLGRWQSPGNVRREFPPRPKVADDRSFTFHTFTHQVYYGLGGLTGGEFDRYRTATQLLARILGGSNSSRLDRRIVEQEGLTSFLATESFNLSNLGVFASGGGVDPEQSERFKQILHEEFAKISAEPVGDDELALAKTLLRADLVRAFESNDGIAAFRASRLLYGLPVSRDVFLDEVTRQTPQDLYVAARVQFPAGELREAEIRPARGFGKVLAALRYLMFRRL